MLFQAHVNSFSFTNNDMWQVYCYIYFKDEDTERQIN